MTLSTGQRRFHFKNVRPQDPDVKPFGEWLPANRTFYASFRTWLREGGYGDSALNQYGVAARLALGWLDLPYWEIDPQTDPSTPDARRPRSGRDLDRVRGYIASHCRMILPSSCRNIDQISSCWHPSD